ncbi:MAG: hypothetical protein JWP19_1642 [Rhodoglobus sp.]|nr:hypothetical protein [Rhodoglobus sp.]
MGRFFTRQRSAGTVAAIASIAVLAIVGPMTASAASVGTIVQLSTFSPADGFTDCGSASIATNPDSGVTLAAWADTISGPGLSAPLSVATIGADAIPGPTTTYQPPDLMPIAVPGDCEPITVSAGANGGFIVTWNDASTDGAIYAILVDSAGAFIGGAFAVSSNTDYSDIETTSAAWDAADSQYLVTWKANVLSPFPLAANRQQIVGRFLDGTGTPVGTDFLVTDIVAQINNSQDVAFGGGAWIAVGVANSDSILRAVTVAPDGTVGAAIPVPSPAGTTNGASIAFNAATGQFLIVSRVAAGAWGQLVQPSGALVGAPFAIDTIVGAKGKPRVAATASGWFVTWQNPNLTDIFGIELDAAGVPVGVPEFMSSGTSNPSIELNFRPDVAFSATTGQAYVLWNRYLNTPDETNVVIRAWQTPVIAAPAPAPALAATGVDASRTAVLAGAAILALLAGGVVVGVRRRKTVVGPRR